MKERSWKSFEDYVKVLAQTKWDTIARSEMIAGVNFDCVLHIASDNMIIVEATQNDTLDKIRGDINRHSSAKNANFLKNIYTKSFIVVDGSVTTSMIETGRSNCIEVVSLNDFEKMIFNFEQYNNLRIKQVFGSSIDIETGLPDEMEYVKVRYSLCKINQEECFVDDQDISIDDIRGYILGGSKIIILGEYGSGKSRCIRELYGKISKISSDIKRYPLAINLRENWGLKRGAELIRRHFEELGLTDVPDNILKMRSYDSIIFMLDGFDELATQSWSDEARKLQSMRFESLQSIRDLIDKFPKSTIVISGREHYFNDNKEMFAALGLKFDSTVVIRCHDEFDENELKQFMMKSKNTVEFPDFLPKKPLMCSTILKFEREYLLKILNTEDNEVIFWEKFIDVVCQRETTIRNILDAETIKNIYIEIARFSRVKPLNFGPITLSEIQKAFYSVVGSYPIDQAAVMLQRLPGLGRYEAESENRKFIDTFILDGLRALDVAKIIYVNDKDVVHDSWLNHLQSLGLKILGKSIADNKQQGFVIKYLRGIEDCKNSILVSDIAVAVLFSARDNVDFSGLTLRGTLIEILDLSSIVPTNFNISDSTVFNLVLPEDDPVNFFVTNCEINNIYGISSASGLPGWLKSGRNKIEKYDAIDNVAMIKNSKLSPSQKIFATIIKKTFFQPGAGRKEAALLRGLGEIGSKGLCDIILRLLVSESILKKYKGDDGYVYIPVRKYTNRMKLIMSKLQFSEDDIWVKVTLLN